MRTSSMILLLANALALAGCPGPRAPAPPPAPPRLVVLVVIDQLPAWSFAAKGPAASDGIARAIASGRRWTARYPYAATQTAPGHAALGTGAPPSVTGILSNEWWHREVGKVLKATEDPAGGAPSSRWLRVDGLADTLEAAHPTAKAVAVSLKDRSALLALGHRGLAVWYDEDCGCRKTSAATAPAWLGALEAAHPIGPRLVEPWVASDPDRLAKLSGGPDDAPGELSITGWTATFPHDPKVTKHPEKTVVDTPLGNQLVVEAAIAAIDGEGLGQDDVPDYLAVSFSANDYIGHAFGQDSWESWDEWLALDHQIGDLERALDARVGAGRWAMVLTSDHGGVELPERREARGLPGARFAYDDVAAIGEKAAEAVAGPGPWIASGIFPTLYLTDAARALPDDRRAALIDAVVAALRATPWLDRADRSSDLEGGCAARAGDDRALCLSLDPERSGEIVYDPAPGTVLHKPEWNDAVSHGSLHDYDRDVPLILVAPGVTPGESADQVSPLQIAPTIAQLLGVPPPAAAHEPPLAYGQAASASR